MNKKIYVLIPVYNVEAYLKDCIDSVINQTYSNWEIILVDDGSKDSSGKICDEYAQKDSRIRVIHQENGGLSKARYTAIHALTDTKDTYMTFLDSDDLLPKNALEILYNTAEENSCELVAGGSNKFISGHIPELNSFENTINNLTVLKEKEDIKKKYRAFFGFTGFSVTLWSKLYKTDFFVDIYSKIDEWPFYFGEDLNVTIRIVPEAKKIATVDNVVYLYRDGGGTDKFMKTFVDDCVILYRTKKFHADKYSVSDYTKKLIDIEMKNMAMQYFVMCIRTRTYPHGNLSEEIRYLLDIPEFYNSVCAISEDFLKNDSTEIPGFTQAFVNKDVGKIKRLSEKKANAGKLKRIVKKVLSK